MTLFKEIVAECRCGQLADSSQLCSLFVGRRFRARSILEPASAVYSRREPVMRLPVAPYLVLEQRPKNDFVVDIRLSLARSFDIVRLLNFAIMFFLFISGLL